MLYQVDKNSKAPSNAQAGDYIVTGGGTYEVLDPNQYKGMNPNQLAKAGVSLNPNSGLYSRKVTDKSNTFYTGNTKDYNQVSANANSKLESILGSSGYTFRNYDNTRKATDAYRDQMYAELEGNYAENLGDLKRTYNTNIANQEKQINQVNSAYDKNRNQLYEDTYAGQKSATQIAANRGMTSSAQGLAMNVSGLMQASKRASELTSDRDTLINDINTEMNRITEDYGVDRNTLKKKFKADKLSALSTAELQYMQACLEIDDYNADIWNNAVANKQAQDYESLEAQKQRDFEAAEAAKDRALQSALSRMSSGVDAEEETLDPKIDKYANYLKLRANEGRINEQQYNELFTALEMYSKGQISYEDYAKKYYKTVWNKDYKSGKTIDNLEKQNDYIKYSDYMKALNSNQYNLNSPLYSIQK